MKRLSTNCLHCTRENELKLFLLYMNHNITLTACFNFISHVVHRKHLLYQISRALHGSMCSHCHYPFLHYIHTTKNLSSSRQNMKRSLVPTCSWEVLHLQKAENADLFPHSDWSRDVSVPWQEMRGSILHKLQNKLSFRIDLGKLGNRK